MFRTLLSKELRQHGLAMSLMIVAGLCVAVLGLSYQRSTGMAFSAFDTVRYCLLGVVPLTAAVLANRLFTREQMDRTAAFVNALPVFPGLSMMIRFSLGMGTILLLGLLLVLLAWFEAAPGEDIDAAMLSLVLARTILICLFFWAAAFWAGHSGRFSLVGFGCVLMLAFILYRSPIDWLRDFGPFALTNVHLFAHETDNPGFWAMGQTLVLIAVALAMGNLSRRATIEEGATDQSHLPLSVGFLVAIMVIAATVVFGYLLVMEEDNPVDAPFSGPHQVTNSAPDVSVFYGEPALRDRAVQVSQGVIRVVSLLQAKWNVSEVVPVRVAIEPDREPYEMDMYLGSSVLIKANLASAQPYMDYQVATAAAHEVFDALTRSRSGFALRHWVLDGVSRWLVQQPDALGPQQRAQQQALHDEMMARAIVSIRWHGPPALIRRWESIVDRDGFTTAQALSYAAIAYLHERAGEQAVLNLAGDQLIEPVGRYLPAVLRDRFYTPEQRFVLATGIDWQRFVEDWTAWMREQAKQPSIARLADSVAPWQADIMATVDQGQASLRTRIGAVDSSRVGVVDLPADAACLLRYRQIGPFDTQMLLDATDESDWQACRLDGSPSHEVTLPIAPGKRVYATLGLSHPAFHEPLRLAVQRLTVGEN